VRKRIVITGASGNLGTALLNSLAEAGGRYEIVGIARRAPPRDGVYESVEWHQLDVASTGVELELCNVFRGAACVVHLAWGFRPTGDARYLDAVGIGGSAAVLRAAHFAEVPQLVHMSSVGAYAPGRYGQRVDESWSTAGVPSSAYSRAKSAVEEMLDGYEQDEPHGVGITRLRPGFILQHNAAAGLRSYGVPAYVDPGWLRRLGGLPLDRSLTLSMVHAEDVADACLRVIERHALGPFNLAAESPVHRSDGADALSTKPIHLSSGVSGSPVQASWRTRARQIDRGWLDLAFSAPLLATDRARAELDWSPRWSAPEASPGFLNGFLRQAGTRSPVLRPRSLGGAMTRDLSNGPLTVRRVP